MIQLLQYFFPWKMKNLVNDLLPNTAASVVYEVIGSPDSKPCCVQRCKTQRTDSALSTSAQCWRIAFRLTSPCWVNGKLAGEKKNCLGGLFCSPPLLFLAAFFFPRVFVVSKEARQCRPRPSRHREPACSGSLHRTVTGGATHRGPRDELKSNGRRDECNITGTTACFSHESLLNKAKTADFISWPLRIASLRYAKCYYYYF